MKGLDTRLTPGILASSFEIQMRRIPGLLLALPRSGTNWSVDVLKEAGDARVLMEPFGLHYGKSYEVNPLHPVQASNIEDVSRVYGHERLKDDPYGQLLTINLLQWIQEDTGRVHVIKETDSFFHLQWLLNSIPSLNTVFINRDIRGNVASFKKGGLFEKWNYRERLRQLLRTIQSDQELSESYGHIYDERVVSAQPWVSLTHYLGICSLEIRKQLGRIDNVLELHYEDLVTSPETSFLRMAEHFGICETESIVNKLQATTKAKRSDSTHSTYKKKKHPNNFHQILSVQEIGDISSVWRNFGFDLPAFSRQREISGGAWQLKKKNNRFAVEIADETREMVHRRIINSCIEFQGEMFSEIYVQNKDYASFINWLKINGFPMSIQGRNVFINDLPLNKIHLLNGRCVVEKGYEDHPSNHMNILGAVTFAKWIGGFIPEVDTLKSLMFDEEPKVVTPETANYGHHYPGTTPVRYFQRNKNGLFDAVGNLGAWTSTPFLLPNGEKSRHEFCRIGGAWSRSLEECKNIQDSVKGRPWWMAASTVGIRLGFKSFDLPTEESILLCFSKFLRLLQSKEISIDEKNKLIFEYIKS